MRNTPWSYESRNGDTGVRTRRQSSRKGILCTAHAHAGMSSRDERSKWHCSMTSQSSSNVCIETQRRLLPPIAPSTGAPGGLVLPGKYLPLPLGCIAAAAQRWLCLNCKLGGLGCSVDTRQAHLLKAAASWKLRRLASPLSPARASSVRNPVDDMVVSHL